MPVTNERYTNEFFSAAVARRPHLAFSARGIASDSGGATATAISIESEIWLAVRRRTGVRYTRLVDRGAKDVVADVERRRQVGVLHVRPQRQREHLAGRHRRRRAAS